MLTKRDERGSCLLVMEHYKSGFINRFMRIGENKSDGSRGPRLNKGDKASPDKG